MSAIDGSTEDEYVVIGTAVAPGSEIEGAAERTAIVTIDDVVIDRSETSEVGLDQGAPLVTLTAAHALGAGSPVLDLNGMIGARADIPEYPIPPGIPGAGGDTDVEEAATGRLPCAVITASTIREGYAQHLSEQSQPS